MINLEDDKVVFVNSKEIIFFNYKIQKVVRRFSARNKIKNLLNISDSKIAYSDGWYEGYIFDYESGQREKVVKMEKEITTICNINDEVLMFEDEEAQRVFYNHKQKCIEEKKSPLPRDLKHSCLLSDNRVALMSKREVILYENLYKNSQKPIKSIRIYDDGVVSLYDYEADELSLIDTK